jgi:hypothetical protein
MLQDYQVDTTLILLKDVGKSAKSAALQGFSRRRYLSDAATSV